MNEPEPPVRDFVDRSLRDLLSKPLNLRGVVGEVAPHLVGHFVFEQMQPAPREYLLGNWRSREADLLFEVPFRLPEREDWALVCILLEHQTKADWRIPLITLIYAALYWERQLRQWEELKPPRLDFLLRPILPIVLHTGARPWGAVKTLRDLLVEPAAFRPYLPDWQPLFWELAQHSTDQLLHSGEALFSALALLRVEEEEQTEAARTFLSALQQLEPLHETNIVRWQDLLKFMIGWAQHRRPRQERPSWTTLVEQMQADEQRRREVKAMQMTIADEIRLEGEAEGKAKGKAEALHEVLLRQGRKKFGEPDATTRQTLQSITDLGRLEQLSDRLLDVHSWNDLVAVH